MGVDRTGRTRFALYATVVGAFLAFVLWTAHVVLTVRGLRTDVERLVGALSTLSRIQARLDGASEQELESSLNDLQSVAADLAHERAVDPQLDEAIGQVDAAIRGERAGAATGSRQAIERLVAMIRKRTAEVSRRLGEQWDSLYAIVAAALVLAALTCGLVIHTWTARVARLVQERDLAVERARHANRLAAIGTMAAAAAHEIGNPLTFTLLNLEHLRDQLAGSPDLQEVAEEALDGLERVRGITSDLKGFASPDEGATTGVDVVVAVETALRLFEPARGNDVRIIKRLAEVPKVRASQRRLEQVLLNLLLNANHAIGSEKPGTIIVETAAEAGSTVLRIVDDGRGISPEVEKRLFQAFATSRASDDGTGLGLFVSRSIVEAVGGTLVLSPNPGGGAVAEVKLPASAA